MSHFSTVKTQLRKKEFLKQALIDLGYIPNHGVNIVRGYRGQTVKAEMAVNMPNGGDIGFRWNSNTQSYLFGQGAQGRLKSEHHLIW